MVTQAIGLGVPKKLAAQLVRVDYAIFQQVLQQDEAFRLAVGESEAQLVRACLAAIITAAQKGNWQAASWLLERRYPQYFGKAEKHEPEFRSTTLTVEYVKAIRIALGVEDPESKLPPGEGGQAIAGARDGEPHAVDILPADLDARGQPAGPGGEGRPDRIFDGKRGVGDHPGD